MWKPEAELEKVVRFIRYERHMFDWATEQIPRGPTAHEWRCGTGMVEEPIRVTIEAALIHARALRDFFCRRRKELSKRDETDILAEDFFNDPGDWQMPAFTYLEAKRVRLNRALAHLAYDRTAYLSDEDWDFQEITNEIHCAWDEFLKRLPEHRADWFTHPYLP